MKAICLEMLFVLIFGHYANSQPVSNIQYVDPTIGSVGQILEPTRPAAYLPNSMIRVFPVRRGALDDQINYFPLTISAHRQPDLSSIQLTWAAHPRLFFGKAEEAIILKRAKENPLLSQLMDFLKAAADKDLKAMPQNYKPDAELLSISPEQISRVLTLSMACRLLKEEKYAQKAEAELLNVCAFPSWHPEHYLDVAEMATAVAIGYDWCYNYLSPATRTTIEKAIVQNAFTPAWPIYESNDKKTPFNRENNWNMVCNSGMVNAALAIGDKYPAEAKRIVQYAVQYTPNLLQSFAPEGVYNEGPGYWAYNSMYMALFFDNLQRNVHNDFGLPAYKGIAQTTRFYEGIAGPSGQMFNFGDASTRIDNSGTFFYLSKQYHLPQAAMFYRGLLRTTLNTYANDPDFEISRFLFLAIPWFDEAVIPAAQKQKSLEVLNGMTDFIIINGNNKTDSNRLYLAAKTGRPEWSHNHLDVGSFVLDCDGQRWATDLGADSYSLPDFWSYEPGGQRWKYFRNTNLAHNTLSMDDSITISTGQGELLRSNDNATQPYGIFDMTAAYARQASSVLRGFSLLNPNTVLIRDEIKLINNTGKITWRMLTNAAVTVTDGTATLTQQGKHFYIRCLLKSGYTMNVVKAKPYTEKEKPIKNTSMIEITVNAENNVAAIPVLMSNSLERINKNAGINTSLNNWK